MQFKSKKEKFPNKELSIEERVSSFKEVSFSYDEETALFEASRCLNCKNPTCIKGCPLNKNIPLFISKILEKDYDGANEVVDQAGPFGSICSRVCSQEKQCEGSCIKGRIGEPVAIGNLERFVTDRKLRKILNNKINNDKKIAVIGAGPSGLACAYYLNKEGYSVTVFEEESMAGGLLRYGIPEFRLDRSVLDLEINSLIDSGIKFKFNQKINKDFNLKNLKYSGSAAIFIGLGASEPKLMGNNEEKINGVYTGHDFLKIISKDVKALNFENKKVAVIGGGNVAMDSARTAIRLGAKEVTVIYRRTFDEITAGKIEILHAQQEGVKFKILAVPQYFNQKDGKLVGLTCVNMELGEPDSTGRRSPVVVPGSEFNIDVDVAIIAISSSTSPDIKDIDENLELTDRNLIKVDNITYKTSVEGVFAGGDVINGPSTVVKAIKNGIDAAKEIIDYLKNI